MRVPVRRMIIVLSFAVLLNFSINAEQLNNKFLQTQWTTENGLPQNSVSSIAQTPDGYLWLGTFGGLARFDGVRFKIYTTSNTPELKSNRISAMTTDHEGTLWIGTERGEIICFKDGKFLLIDDGKEIGNTAISDLFADENNILWAGSGKGIKTCKEKICKMTDFLLPSNYIRKDLEGNVWLISSGNLFKFKEGKFAADNLFSADIVAIESNRNGGLWIIKNIELGIYQNGDYRTLIKFKKKVGFAGTFVSADGSFWLNTFNTLYHIKNGEISEYEIKNISELTARRVFIDQEENIWIGRVGDGLIRLLNRRVQTLTEENGFKHISVNSITEDNSGNIWLSTNQGLFSWKDGKIKEFPQDRVNGGFWARGALLFDSEGTLWNGTSEGLQSFRDDKFTLRQDISWTKAMAGNSLFEDSKKNLWFGCENCGVFVSDRQNIIAKYTTENGLVGNIINCIKESRDGSIWFGTRSGISHLKDGKFTNYTNQDGLSNEYVRDIYEDQDGTIWFGTYGGGLNRFKDGKFTSITTKDGLFDDIVSRILVDDNDNFWMLGNRGIYSASRQMLIDFADGKIKQIYCVAYTTADGMKTSEGNGGFQNAGTRTRDGKLWFPMISGVVIIDPKQEKLPPPKPLIEEVFLNGKIVDTTQKVEINPGSESLEINYTGLNFRKPEQIRFRYRLEGLDKNWTEAGTRRLANYPYLPSGNYRFQLQAANADGVWSEDFSAFEIEVYPPFWRTWWFFAIAAVFVCAVLFAIYFYRTWRFARDKAVQEELTRKLLNAQESERRKIAADIHDNLGQQLLVIKNWAAFCLSKMTNRSKIREQLLQIDETAEQALNEIRSMAKSLSPYHLDKAGLTNTLRFLVKQVAESSKIEFRTEIDNVDGVLSKDGELNVYRIVQESLNNILRHSQATEASVILERNRNNLRLSINDNGIGFRETETDFQKIGLGLDGMKKRAQMIGGEVSVQSAPTKGTKIFVEIKTRDSKK